MPRAAATTALIRRLAPRPGVAALAAVALCLGPPPRAAAAAVSWAWPVRGAVVRAFAYSPADPFRRGQRRGVDLAARAGTPVRAACAGRVVTARPGWVVTLRCGPWRVTHLPMASVRVRVGDHVGAGRRLGALGTRRRIPGLHLGVRRAGDRFAYVDPLAFLPPDRGPRLGPLPPGPRRRHPAPSPLRLAPPPAPAQRGLRPAPRAAQPGRLRGWVRVPAARPLAPWPAWVGLGSVLCAALGGGVRWRVRARRVRATARAGEGVA